MATSPSRGLLGRLVRTLPPGRSHRRGAGRRGAPATVAKVNIDDHGAIAELRDHVHPTLPSKRAAGVERMVGLAAGRSSGFEPHTSRAAEAAVTPQNFQDHSMSGSLLGPPDLSRWASGLHVNTAPSRHVRRIASSVAESIWMAPLSAGLGSTMNCPVVIQADSGRAQEPWRGWARERGLLLRHDGRDGFPPGFAFFFAVAGVFGGRPSRRSKPVARRAPRESRAPEARLSHRAGG
jgi:hypothetical protein